MIVEEDGLRGDTLRNHNFVFVVVVAASITTVQTVTPGLFSFLIFILNGHGWAKGKGGPDSGPPYFVTMKTSDFQ